MLSRLRVATVAAIALAGAALPSAAIGSSIVYQCGLNLCRIAPDGSGQAQVTTDGTSVRPYTWPSLSRDGTRMAWIRNGDLFLGDAGAQAATGPVVRSAIYDVIRPDGAQVGALVMSYVFHGAYYYAYDAAGETVFSGPEPANYSLGWGPSNEVLLPWADAASSKIGICTAAPDPQGGWMCVTRVAQDATNDLNYPAVSPDGRTLAVVVGSRNDSGGRIALYDYASHTFVRFVTAGPVDALPSWSPDSARIVFQRGGGTATALYVVSADGAGERLLVGGGAQTPTWGGPADATGGGAAARGLQIAGEQRGRHVHAKLTVLTAGSTVAARLTTTSGRLLGSTTKRGTRAGTLKLTVPLNRTGRSALRRARALKLKLKLKIAVTAPSGTRTTLAGTLRLRR